MYVVVRVQRFRSFVQVEPSETPSTVFFLCLPLPPTLPIITAQALPTTSLNVSDARPPVPHWPKLRYVARHKLNRETDGRVRQLVCLRPQHLPLPRNSAEIF